MGSLIRFRDVSKAYPLYAQPSDRLKELLTFNRLKRHRDFWALRNVSFEIPAGETFCVLGENGSGKSTLLGIMSGILQPTSGEAKVEGRLAALLELGSGFNPEFTGRENLRLNAAIHGLSSDEIEARLPAIEAFADIGDFVHQPVRTYSSGMAVRLAFSVAVHLDPEILLVDEALSVGDIYFRQRCMRRIHQLRASGTTIVFVSHSLADVKAIGHRGMWLAHGEIRALGDIDDVVSRYAEFVLAKDRQQAEEVATLPSNPTPAPRNASGIPNVDHRHGSGRAHITGIALLDASERPIAAVQPKQQVILRVTAEAHRYLASPNLGFMLRNHMGVDFAGSNTLREGVELPALHPGDLVTVDFRLELPELYPGNFSFSPAIADGDLQQYDMCDWIDNALAFQVLRGDNEVYGYLHLPCSVSVHLDAPLRTSASA